MLSERLASAHSGESASMMIGYNTVGGEIEQVGAVGGVYADQRRAKR
jgi:hypothetical protein